MNRTPEDLQAAAVNELTGKMLSQMGFTQGQEISWYEPSGGGEQMNFWVYGVELEMVETGSTTPYTVKLEDLPLDELLNKSHENAAITVGTALSFDVSEPSGDYRIRPRRLTKRGTVVGIKVVVNDYRLRTSSFDPAFLKTQSSSGGVRRKTKKTRRNRRRYSRRK